LDSTESGRLIAPGHPFLDRIDARLPPYYVALAVKKPHLRPTIAQRQFAQVRATAAGAVPARDPRSSNIAGYQIEFGVQRGNQFTPLPGGPGPGPGSWPTW
jgi:hypothetical protein